MGIQLNLDPKKGPIVETIDITSINDSYPKYLNKSGEFKPIEEKKKDLNCISNSDVYYILELIKSQRKDTTPGFRNSIFLRALQYLNKYYNGYLKDKLELCKKIYSNGLKDGIILEDDAFIYG